MMTLTIKLGNLHPKSLCTERRLWRLVSSFIIVCYGYVSGETISRSVQW